MPKQKFYVVWKGREPGIYSSWDECARQVNGFSGAKYKSFSSQAQAQAAFEAGWQASTGKSTAAILPPEVIRDSLCVDAACQSNRYNLEYRGVETATGKLLFHRGPFSRGTNNLGEFLAIVEGLQQLQQQGKSSPVYSDSRNAILWVKKQYIGSKLPRTPQTEAVWQQADAALQWLKNNRYSNPILKWDTENWGEIPADFGRK